MRQSTIFDEMIIDNFAGGGGASTGIEAALGRSGDGYGDGYGLVNQEWLKSCPAN